jgi:phenylalanine-4-hydroxylase
MSLTHEKLLDKVPVHLQQYVVEQDYNRYTPRDQAVWRYIMRKNLNFLGRHAHESYLEGLEKTGISIDTIPDVLEMNRQLEKIGWNAVVVNGFIPPAAFMEFQANRILVISAEMRSIEHILYTPAPDIVHEAAGHAPIIADPEYAQFLQKFGEYGSKAIASKEDFAVYEAIRKLSIIKEYPNASDQEIKQAEAQLERALAQNQTASEAAKLSRMHWWTVEYGLIGKTDDYKLYGAGLLSSVGESQECMKPVVKKLPMSIDCVNYDYDITSMQPQLFVTQDWQQLMDVLDKFAANMGFRTGGVAVLEQAMASENVATAVYSSGLQVSGKITQVMTGNENNPIYIRTTGATSLAVNDKELAGHGTGYHADGFGSPVGMLDNEDTALENFSDTDLSRHEIQQGKKAQLLFRSGITVTGEVRHITRQKGKLILISFADCKVTTGDGSVLFQPEWGMYDMAVGAEILSVFSGSADKEKFNVLPGKSELTAIEVRYDQKTQNLFSLYQKTRNMRHDETATNEIPVIYEDLKNNFPDEWLLRLEILELINHQSEHEALGKTVLNDLAEIKKTTPELKDLIESGLEFLTSIPKDDDYI